MARRRRPALRNFLLVGCVSLLEDREKQEGDRG
jgi:hypothetical protein